MTPKKFTRGFFYTLFGAFVSAAVVGTVMLFVTEWDSLWVIACAIGVGLGCYLLLKLYNWAFSGEKPYPFQYSPMPTHYPVPNYFNSEEAGLLSDGRSAVPFYKSGKFAGRLPENPFLDERVGDYRWGKSHHGDWVWIYDPMIIETEK